MTPTAAKATGASRTPQVLALNAGSSSIKFALFDAAPELHQTGAGRIERIGAGSTRLKASGAAFGAAADRGVDCALDASDHRAATRALLGWFEQHQPLDALTAVGHRLVRGAPLYRAPQCVDAEMIERLRQLSPFDTQHLPHEIDLIETLRERCPGLPQVACFDTAFHSRLPAVASLLPIPRRYAEQGVRRYGFHGLSYQFLMHELAQQGGDAAARGRVVMAHLGNGASLAAVHAGQPVDTSMGYTPNSGVPMSTRSGDLDPGVLRYLARTERLDAEQLDRLLTTESGLLGVSGSSADMRDLLERESSDVHAAEAAALFCYQVKKCIGAYAAALGGIDTLVFSGGIGENSAEVRTRVCSGLGFLGIELDAASNTANAGVISARGAAVVVRVIRTDEELVIARSVCELLGLQPPHREQPPHEPPAATPPQHRPGSAEPGAFPTTTGDGT